MRKCILLGVLLIAGCDEPLRPAATTSTAPRKEPVDPTDLDFSRWPTATAKPITQWGVLAAECRDPRVEFGPHTVDAIVVRVNPEAFEDFKAKRPLAVGSVVVKEKHADDKADKPPHGYTAMVKREPGYDPDHGDWEYADVKLTAEKKSTRGKLQSCIACHDGKKTDDYLFRDYLK